MKRELDLSLTFDLCSAPSQASMDLQKRATRVAVSCVSEFAGLVLKKPDYERQYAPLYFSRLRQLRTVFSENAPPAFDLKLGIPFREQLIKVQLQEECWVVGTLFREMTRPSALDAYNDVPVAVKDCYASPTDKIVIEDETGRAVLVDGGADLSEVVTGLVVALRCVEQQSGELLVKQLVYPGVAPLFKPPSVASPLAGCIGVECSR